jgi:hypothetical protein
VSEGAACSLLHHNYLNYVSSIKDACEACAWLSDSDALLAKWDPTHALAGYAGLIAARGLLHAKRQPVQHKFMPLHRAQRPEDEAARRRAHMLTVAAGVLQGRHEARQLLCETLPLLAKCAHHHQGLAPAHTRALQDLTAFTALRSGVRCSTRYNATASERIDENDAAAVDDAPVAVHVGQHRGGFGANAAAAGSFGGNWGGVGGNWGEGGAGVVWGGQHQQGLAAPGDAGHAGDVIEDIEDFLD